MRPEKQVSVRLTQPHFVHGEVREADTVVVLPESIAALFGEVEGGQADKPKPETADGKGGTKKAA